MEFVNDIGQVLVLAAEAAEGGEEEGGSFLVSPGLGLMIWTLLFFGITVFFLSRKVFPRIQEALDKRAKLIAESIEAAERSKNEAEQLTAEYQARLKEAREQADDIVARARKAAETRRSPRRPTRARRSARSWWPPRGATSRPRPGARWTASARRSPS